MTSKYFLQYQQSNQREISKPSYIGSADVESDLYFKIRHRTVRHKHWVFNKNGCIGVLDGVGETWINNIPVEKSSPIKIKNGDTLRIGKIRLQFEEIIELSDEESDTTEPIDTDEPIDTNEPIDLTAPIKDYFGFKPLDPVWRCHPELCTKQNLQSPLFREYERRN